MKISNKNKPAQDPRNLVQLARGEIGAVVQETVDQIVAGEGNRPVTELPPSPESQSQEKGAVSSVPSPEEAAKDKEEQLKRVRTRLAVLKEESDLAGKKLFQEREEKAQKRNPVIEGVEVGAGKDGEENNSQEKQALPPPETSSRPKRGLPLGIGQPEKRQKR
ncbi:MAG: hypothetical protein PHR64_01020 [Candidatus Shapirobacteria bacterium]|nr:hypothetical protein [Candidatus Shapirobacteria bacterium]MDD5481514.1 hypothetical protein [Candidatus Shapirobacteria bacterium]